MNNKRKVNVELYGIGKQPHVQKQLIAAWSEEQEEQMGGILAGMCLLMMRQFPDKEQLVMYRNGDRITHDKFDTWLAYHLMAYTKLQYNR